MASRLTWSASFSRRLTSTQCSSTWLVFAQQGDRLLQFLACLRMIPARTLADGDG